MGTETGRTQVGIIGAGPAGLLLSQLLHLEGIESVIVENQTRAHVENRIRAGVLEQGSVDVLNEAGLGARMGKEGMVHAGIELSFARQRHRIDFADLTGGRTITVYGQHEAVKDMIAARLAAGGRILFEATGASLHGLETDTPAIDYTHDGRQHTLTCEIVAGCDGYHGVSRASIPTGVITEYERDYPFGWLGILAEAPPASDELVYAHHEDGFALFSMRSPALTRLYLQCRPDEDLRDWPDARIWEALHTRLEAGGDGFRVNEGRILQKGVTPMRSFVAAPMRYKRLFLAGDAAHIVPPTGAKGMNLAVADVAVLARALARFFRANDTQGLERYSDTCLRRVWKVQRFSWWMTSLLHNFPGAGPFDQRIQLAELDYVTGSRAASQTLAENYVGLPLA